MFARIFLCFLILRSFSFCSFAQEANVVTISPIQENQTLRNEQQLPSSLVNKRNDWWLPPTIDQEITQPNPYQYSQWIQPPIPTNYYISGQPYASPVGQLRSEHFPFPEYSEYSHGSSMVPHGSGNPLGIGSKHLAIVSFIGLLLLFAIIQNSLMSAKRKDALVEALTGRKKRDLLVAHGLEPLSSEQAEMLYDDAKLRCVQKTVCFENRRIVENFGPAGKKLAKYLTNEMTRSMRKSSGWARLVADAGEAGLRGENCNILYRDCTAGPETSRFSGKAEDRRATVRRRRKRWNVTGF